MIPLIDLKLQYKSIKKEIDKAVSKVLTNADFILGEEVDLLEKEFAQYVGTKYAVGIDSGISALELGMRALGIGPGDEILTPVNSFIASSSAISFTGATPVLVECEEKTYNIDITDAEKRITKKTKAIMPVHLYGQVVSISKVLSFARRYKLLVIEDACQAHGAKFKGKGAGSFGDFGAFSFYPGKNLGAYGDGGMLTTDNKKIHDTVKMMRNYGQKEKYNHIFLAWNKRLDNLQAAILRVKLKHLDSWNRLRQRHAKHYTKLLGGIVETPHEEKGAGHIYHQYVIRTKKRDALLKHLHSKGIGAGIHYPIPIHLQPAYKNLGYKKGDFPLAEKYAREILSLPMYPELTGKKIKLVAKEIKNFLSQKM